MRLPRDRHTDARDHNRFRVVHDSRYNDVDDDDDDDDDDVTEVLIVLCGPSTASISTCLHSVGFTLSR